MDTAKLTDLTVGTIGVAAVAVTDTVATAALPSAEESSAIIQTLIQVVIGIATLFKLFKRKPKNQNPNTEA